MEFLKSVLGERFDEFSKIIKTHNENNPENVIKLANLSEGGYVDKDKYAALKTKFEKETGRLLEEAEGIKKTFAIELAVKEEKPKNAKALKALLDIDAITYEDGVLGGFSEQMEAIRKENGFLFEEEKHLPKFTHSAFGAEAEMTKEEFKKLGYMEKLRLKKEAPQIYAKLK